MKAPEKIEAVWDQDAHDNSILVLEKEEGKLSLAEVGNFLRYSHNGSFNGDYVMAICTKEGQEEAPREISGCSTKWNQVQGARYVEISSHFMKQRGKLIEK